MSAAAPTLRVPAARPNAFVAERIAAIEGELRKCLRPRHSAFGPFYELMRYHVGVDGESVGAKRFRPLLCLLIHEGLTGDFRPALPLAAAIELLHNFTLVHDDIEDGDALRRHRPAIWRLCGVAQGINVGDAVYALSGCALHELERGGVPAEVEVRIARRFSRLAIRMSEGQFLDLAATIRTEPTLHSYRFMASRKTGALIATSAQLAAILAEADARTRLGAARFGANLGLAFQAFDDWKGTWGQEGQTGKSGQGDLRQRKVTLPIVLALAAPTNEPDELRELWQRTSWGDAEAARVREIVTRCGVESVLWDYAERRMARARAGLRGLGLLPWMTAAIDRLIMQLKPERPAA